MADYADTVLPRVIAEATSSWANDIKLPPGADRKAQAEAENGWALQSEKLPTHEDYREDFLRKQQQRGGVKVDIETGVVQVVDPEQLLGLNREFNSAETIKDLKVAMAVLPSSVEEVQGASSPITPHIATFRSYKYTPDINKAVAILEGLNDQEIIQLRTEYGPELQRIFLREPDDKKVSFFENPFQWLVGDINAINRVEDHRENSPFSVEQWERLTVQLSRGSGCQFDVIRQIAHLRAVEEVPLQVMQHRTGVGTEGDQASDVVGVVVNLGEYVGDLEKFEQVWKQLTGISVGEWVENASNRCQRREKHRQNGK